jgi:hypothetical protein
MVYIYTDLLSGSRCFLGSSGLQNIRYTGHTRKTCSYLGSSLCGFLLFLCIVFGNLNATLSRLGIRGIVLRDEDKYTMTS